MTTAHNAAMRSTLFARYGLVWITGAAMITLSVLTAHMVSVIVVHLKDVSHGAMSTLLPLVIAATVPNYFQRERKLKHEENSKGIMPRVKSLN